MSAGDIYAWGTGEIPTKVSKLTGITFDGFSGAGDYVAAVSREGIVDFIHGSNASRSGSVENDKFGLTRAAGNVPNAFQMTFGKSHGIAIDSSERVHAWGRGDVGQTGLGHCDDVGLNDEAKPWPLKIKDPITLVVASDTHSIALCSNGEIFSWGDGYRGQHGFGAQRPQMAPKILSVGLKRIKSIACGASFTVAATVKGKLWSWGENSSGQLGLGDNKMRARPTPVPTPHGPFEMVAAGWCHALALNQEGNVVAWGFGLKGQLGLLDKRSRKFPTLVPAPFYMAPGHEWCMEPPEWNAKLIGAGSYYSVVVQKDDKVYTFGGKSFPLGLGYDVEASACTEPKLVKTLLEKRVAIAQLACASHTVAVIARPKLEALSIHSAPFTGGTPVVLSGTSFYDSERIRVRFSAEKEGLKPLALKGTYKDEDDTVSSFTPPMPEEYIPKAEVVDSDDDEEEEEKPPFDPNLLTKLAIAFDVDVTYTLEQIPFLFYQDPMPTSVLPKLAPLKGGGSEIKLFATGLFKPFDTPCVKFQINLGRKAKRESIEKVVDARVVLDEENPDQSYVVCVTPNFEEGNEDIQIPTPCKATMWLSMNGRDYLDKSVYVKPVVITLFDDLVLQSTPGCALVGKTAKTLIKFRGIPKSNDLTVQLKVADKTFELKSRITNSTTVEAKLPAMADLSAEMLFEVKEKPKPVEETTEGEGEAEASNEEAAAAEEEEAAPEPEPEPEETTKKTEKKENKKGKKGKKDKKESKKGKKAKKEKKTPAKKGKDKDKKKTSPGKKDESKKSPGKEETKKSEGKKKKTGKKKEEEEVEEEIPIPSGYIEGQILVSLNNAEFSRPHPFIFYSGAIGALMAGSTTATCGPNAGGTSINIPCDPEEHSWMFNSSSINVYFAGTKKPVEGVFVEEPVPCISCKTPKVLTVGPAAVKVSMTGEESDAVVAAHLPCEFVYYKTPKITAVSLEDEPVAEDAMIEDGPPPKKIVVIKGTNFAEAESIKVAFWRHGVQVVVDGTLKGEKKSAKVTCVLPDKKDLPTAPKEEPPEPAETTTEEGAEPAPEDENEKKEEEEAAPEPVEEGPPVPLVVEVSFNNGIQFTDNGVELELPVE